MTDYPDADLIENLQHNVNHCDPLHVATSMKRNDVLIAKVPSLTPVSVEY